MKHLKNAIYIIFALTVIISCEKETVIEPENQQVNEPYLSFEEKLELMKNDPSEQTYYAQRSEVFNVVYTDICGTINSLELDPYDNGYQRPDLWDFYSFYGVVGQQVSIWVDRTSSWDPMMSLFFGVTTSIDGVSYSNGGENLQFIYSWDDQVNDEFGCYSEPRIIDYSLPYTGEYTLAVYVLNNCGANPPTYNLVTNINSGCTDRDGDGILNEDDPYPNSNMSESLYIGRDYLDIDNIFVEPGMTMMDQIDELIAEINEQYDGENWDELHRDFTRAIARITYYWSKDRLITRGERGEIASAASSSNIPYGRIKIPN